MFELKIAFRRLFQKGEYTLPRLLSLIAGLAFGILLFSEVLYYYSINRFYPDSDRVYEVSTEYKLGSESSDYTNHPATSGAVGPGIQKEIPGVEAATRVNSVGTIDFYTEDQKRYNAKFVFADEQLFDVLERPILEGEAKAILSTPMTCLVSSDIEEEMGGNAIGRTIEAKGFPGKKITIAGIFEALPENVSYTYDIAISMVSTGQFTWDGSNNWIGNDRYYTCIKLHKGVDPLSLAPAIRQVQVKYQDIERLEKENNLSMHFVLTCIDQVFVSKTKTMIIVLSAIGFLVLFVSLMNYVLLTLNALIGRLKTSAIYKTCGAQASSLYRLLFTETIVLFSIAIIGAGFIILLLKPMVENYVNHKLSSTFTFQVIAPISIGLVLVVFLASFLPGRYFSKVPILSAFRETKVNRNKWKLLLLGTQFVGVAFIISTLMVVTLQYNKLTDSDHGFDVERVYYGSTNGMNVSKIDVVLDELKSMPEVETVSLCMEVPLHGASGNNIKSEDNTSDLFNIADFYYIDENYLSVMNMEIVEGINFDPTSSQKGDILISKKGADLLRIHNKWEEVIGRKIEISELGGGTIQGVYPDFVINSLTDFDARASVFHYLKTSDFIAEQKQDPSESFKIAMKIKQGMEAGISEKLASVFNIAYNEEEAIIVSLEQRKETVYHPQLGFKRAMVAGNIVVIFVMLLGLIGYTSSEGTRRAKELAIHKVNGAEFTEIVWLFIKEVIVIAIPTLLLGVVGSWLIAERWMESFAQKAELNILLFILCSVSIFVAIIVISITNYSRICNANPVKYLRSE